MTTQTEALNLALVALDIVKIHYTQNRHVNEAIIAIKEALAQPEQEPVAWMYPDALCDRSCLYVCTKAFTQFPECATTPPQRTWVGLTDEQKHQLNQSLNLQGRFPIIDAIEAICKGNNT